MRSLNKKYHSWEYCFSSKSFYFIQWSRIGYISNFLERILTKYFHLCAYKIIWSSEITNQAQFSEWTMEQKIAWWYLNKIIAASGVQRFACHAFTACDSLMSILCWKHSSKVYLVRLKFNGTCYRDILPQFLNIKKWMCKDMEFQHYGTMWQILRYIAWLCRFPFWLLELVILIVRNLNFSLVLFQV